MKLRQLLQGIQTIGKVTDLTGDVTSICYAADQCGPGSLFVAIPGLVHDGHDFIEQAQKLGARFIVYQNDIHVPEGIIAVRVPDSRRALGALARNFFQNPSSRLVLIGITGTSGKTTVSYLLESILEAAGFCCGVLGTVNYRYGGKILPAPNTTPESCDMQKMLREMADAGVTHVIAEVSSHALDLQRVDDCDFDLGIFTNLSPEHLDYHRDMEDYFRAKKRFFTQLLPESKKQLPYKAVINADDEWGKKLISATEIPVLTYGGKGDVTALRQEISLSGIRAVVAAPGKTIAVSSALIGQFNLSNILAAAAAASILGIQPAAIEAGIKNLRLVPGRLESVDLSAGIHVFVDYAHKPDALEQVLQNLNWFKKKRIITVFGCGGNRDHSKRPLMGKTATVYSDLTIVTSDNPRREEPLSIITDIIAGIDRQEIKEVSPDHPDFPQGVHCYCVIADRKAAIEAGIKLAGPDDIVLIAGKGHEDYQILGNTKISFDDRVIAKQALFSRIAAWGGVNFSLAEIVAATGGRLIAGSSAKKVYGVSTDSRRIQPGNLFIALTGDNFDGHDFVQKAIADGAACVMVAAKSGIKPQVDDIDAGVIEVSDTLNALGDLAHAYRLHFSIPVIGITGSSGKTTTKEMLCSILEQEKRTLKTEGNLNNLIGLPQTIFRLTRQHEIAVLEMGTNTKGEIKRLTRIAAPDVGLITNVGPAHLAGFETIAGVREEKGDLYFNMTQSGIAVVNLDDEEICLLARKWSGRRVTFSLKAEADVRATDIEQNDVRGVGFNLLIGGRAQRVEMKVAGIHNIYNALAAAATALACSASLAAIQRGLTSFLPVAGRMEIIALQNGAYLINDAYNANPASVREALLTLKDLKSAHNAFVFLGDMLELGESAPEMHRQIGLLLAEIGVAAVFLQGDFAEMTAAGAVEGGLSGDRIIYLREIEEAVRDLKKRLGSGDWILVKGSRGMRMDRVVLKIRDDVGVAATAGQQGAS